MACSHNGKTKYLNATVYVGEMKVIRDSRAHGHKSHDVSQYLAMMPTLHEMCLEIETLGCYQAQDQTVLAHMTRGTSHFRHQ